MRPRPRRHLVNHRDIQIAIKRQAQRARNRRGRHHQQMRIIALAQKILALRDAEFVLLVNDHQSKPLQGETAIESAHACR